MRLILALILLSLVADSQTVTRTIPANYPYRLQAITTQTASYTGTVPVNGMVGRDLIVTLNVTAADAAGTYDIYVTTTDGISSWDIVHFPQIANATGTYTAVISGSVFPQNVTTASPGVLANTTATLKTDTAGAGNGIKTLGAGLVRHGPWGQTINHSLVAAGTITTGITYSITITAK